MLLQVDASSPVPLYDQIAAEVRRAIAQGGVGVGDQLPPARVLAEELDVNMHTVLRAYATLRDEGLIELRRGRGAQVKRDTGPERAALTDLAHALVAEAKRQGLSRTDLLTLVERLI